MRQLAWMLMGTGLLLFGCDGGEEPSPDNGSSDGTDVREGIVTDKAPEKVSEVLEGITDDNIGAEVTVTGKIGDMMDGFAAFRLLDLKLKDCYRDGKNCCDIPWDY